LHEKQQICVIFEDYLGNPLRRIFMLFRVSNAIATNGRLIPKTNTSTGITSTNLGLQINKMIIG